MLRPRLFAALSFPKASTRHVSAVSLAYTLHPSPDSSNRPPILIAHGLFGSKQNWRTLSTAIAKELVRDVYALDLRNHGDSPHSHVFTYEAMAEDIQAFIMNLKIPKVTLIGHSMGAKAAMAVALQNPLMVDRLIVVENSPIDAVLCSNFSRYIRAMKKIEAKKVKKQSQADEILQEEEQSLAIRRFLLTNLVRDSNQDYLSWRVPLDIFAKALNYIGDFPFDPRNSRYTGPTLFIRGTHSPYIADEAIPVIGQYFPRFIMVDIPGGHWVHAEQPEKFKCAVIDFLRNDQDA